MVHHLDVEGEEQQRVMGRKDAGAGLGLSIGGIRA